MCIRESDLRFYFIYLCTSYLERRNNETKHIQTHEVVLTNHTYESKTIDATPFPTIKPQSHHKHRAAVKRRSGALTGIMHTHISIYSYGYHVNPIHPLKITNAPQDQK